MYKRLAVSAWVTVREAALEVLHPAAEARAHRRLYWTGPAILAVTAPATHLAAQST